MLVADKRNGGTPVLRGKREWQETQVTSDMRLFGSRLKLRIATSCVPVS